MPTQHQITQPCDLLDDKGRLTQSGYALSPLWRYDRSKIKAGWHRIKEWDYYAVLSAERGYGITFTIADLGYLGLAAICWLDFKARTYKQLDAMTLLPRGRMGLSPASGSGRVDFKSRNLSLTYDVGSNQRKITVAAPGFSMGLGGKGLKGEIALTQPEKADTMVIASAWKENPRAFYYNQKINCMPAAGSIEIGERTYPFDPADSFGVLDWGRGNWTYKNRWYWGSASGIQDGHLVGWNLGYGFSDRSRATENMLFYDGRAHKLDEVEFHMDTHDYLRPWRFSSSDGRFEMDFEPIIDRQSRTDFGLIKSVQHQVFGYFNGYMVFDDGTRLRVRDFLGFAEDVLNWW